VIQLLQNHREGIDSIGEGAPAAPDEAGSAGALKKSLRSKLHQAVVTVLAACRREAHLTQEDLAKQLGWHRSRLAKVESGERRIDVVEFITVARALRLGP
jgi:DNA-binding XRE family transcriptional regulator